MGMFENKKNFLLDLLKEKYSINRIEEEKYFIEFFDKINFCPKSFKNHKIKTSDKLFEGKYKNFILKTEINIDLDIKKIFGTDKDDLPNQYILDSIFNYRRFDKAIKRIILEGVDEFMSYYNDCVLNKEIVFDYFCDEDEFYVNGDGNHRTILAKVIAHSNQKKQVIKNVQVNCYKVNREYYKYYQLLKNFCKKHSKYEPCLCSNMDFTTIDLVYNGIYSAKYKFCNENEIYNFLKNEYSFLGCINRCLGGFLNHVKKQKLPN